MALEQPSEVENNKYLEREPKFAMTVIMEEKHVMKTQKPHNYQVQYANTFVVKVE